MVLKEVCGYCEPPRTYSNAKNVFYMHNATAYYDAHFGESSGPYHLDNVYCNGHEANLTACHRQYTSGGVYNNGIGVHNCAPGNEAGVKCDGRWTVVLLPGTNC